MVIENFTYKFIYRLEKSKNTIINALVNPDKTDTRLVPNYGIHAVYTVIYVL